MLFGLSVFGLAGTIYAWILTFLQLNIAQSFAGMQFIAVIVDSAIVLAEPISPFRWLGIFFIFFGFIIVSISYRLASMNQTVGISTRGAGNHAA